MRLIAATPIAFLVFSHAVSASPSGDWCETLKASTSYLYEDAENTIIQSFKIGNRLHWQAYHLNGKDQAGNSFHHSDNEFRRFRPSTKIAFLRYFTLDLSANLVSDRHFAKGETDWQFQNYGKSILTFDIRNLFEISDFDKLAFSYGRQKLSVTYEGMQSSDRFITIERSATANMLSGGRYPTGLNLAVGKMPWLLNFGIYNGIDEKSLEASHEGLAYFVSFDYQLSDSWALRTDVIVNNLSETHQNIFTYDWGGSINLIYDKESFGLLATLALADNGSQPAGRGGDYYGIVIMPWIWIIPEKTQLVFQYNRLESSQPAAIRANTRYLAGSQAFAPVNSGRGDQLDTFYLGINQYLCSKKLRLMVGAEYDILRTPGGHVETLTTSMAIRLSF
ncbi:MAG: hypothetical protein IZT59_11710 [Verrucomicrobia bacterium]|nr:hypothetical protein [Verrucomicrobiota bacterium]